MNLVRRHQRSIVGVLNAAGPRAFWVAGVATVLLICGVGLLLLRAGAPIMNGRPWDVPICLDGAWRLVHGQVPHRDFFSHLGAFSFYVVRFGIWGDHPGVSSIIHGSVMLMALFTAMSFAVLRRRTSAWFTFLLSAFLAFLVVTPRPLGDPYNCIDHAMIYNRFGDAFLILFGLVVFLPLRSGLGSRWSEGLETALSGLLCAAMFFTKINYLVFAGGLVAVAVVLRLWSPVRLVLLAGWMVVFIAVGLAASRIPLSAMLSDLRLVASSQDTLYRLKTMTIQVLKLVLPVGALAVLAAEATAGTRASGSRVVRWRPWLVSMVCFLTGAAVLASNCQAAEVPLLAVPALFSLELIRRSEIVDEAGVYSTAVRQVISCGLLFYLLWPTFGTDIAAVRHVISTASKRDVIPAGVLAETNLRDFRFAATSTRTLYSEEYSKWLQEGVELLRHHPNAASSLAVILYSDPFHFAIGASPPKGGTVCWLWNAWDTQGRVPLTRLLGGATHVLTSAECKELKATYGAEWESLHAELVDETTHFKIFRVRGNPVTSAGGAAASSRAAGE